MEVGGKVKNVGKGMGKIDGQNGINRYELPDIK